MKEYVFKEFESRYSILENGTIYGIIKGVDTPRRKRLSFYFDVGTGHSKIDLRLRIGRVRKSTQSVAKLLAIAFVPNPENKEFVGFLDGIVSNIKIENLFWATRTEFQRYNQVIGRTTNTKLNKGIVDQIRASTATTKALAAEFGVSSSTIKQIVSGRTWIDKNYTPPTIRHKSIKTTTLMGESYDLELSYKGWQIFVTAVVKNGKVISIRENGTVYLQLLEKKDRVELENKICVYFKSKWDGISK